MLIQPIIYQTNFNKYQIRKNNCVSFKSNPEREEEMRRLAELEEEKRRKKEEERQRAIEAAVERVRVAARKALEVIEQDDLKARKKAAEDTKVIERIISQNRAYAHSINRIKIEMILNAGLNGDTETIAQFKSELEKEKQEKNIHVNAREQAKARAEKELQSAYTKKQANWYAANGGNERARAEIFWADNAIRQAEQALLRCGREEGQDAEDMAEFLALEAAIEDAEKIAKEAIKSKKTAPLSTICTGTCNGSGALSRIANDATGGAGASAIEIEAEQNPETESEIEEEPEEKVSAEDKIEQALYEKRMDILADVQDTINKYPALDNEMSTKMARFLIGFICSIQNNTDHDIGEYFSDEYTAKALREKLKPECRQRSIEDREQLQNFDELKDPVMMLIAANRMKKFVPKAGILSQEQQENLLQGIKDMIIMSVKNSDMSNFDEEDKTAIREILQMIKVSDTTDFGISVKLQSLVDRMNKKKLNLSFIPQVKVRELESQVKKTIKH